MKSVNFKDYAEHFGKYLLRKNSAKLAVQNRMTVAGGYQSKFRGPKTATENKAESPRPRAKTSTGSWPKVIAAKWKQGRKTGPKKPIEPTGPGGLEKKEKIPSKENKKEPKEHVKPTGPWMPEPVDPEQPGQTEQPIDPELPTQTELPVNPEQPVQPGKKKQPGQEKKPVEPVEPVKPGLPEEGKQPGQPGQGKQPGRWKQAKEPGKWKQPKMPGPGMKPGKGKKPGPPEQGKQTEQPELEKWTEKPGLEKQTEQPGQEKQPKQPGQGMKPGPPEQGKQTEQPGLEKQTEQPELQTEQPEIQTRQPEVRTWEPEPWTEQPELQTEPPGRGKEPKQPGQGKKPGQGGQPGQGKQPGQEKKPRKPEQGRQTEQPGLEKQTEHPELQTEQPEVQTGQPEVQTDEPEVWTDEPELQTGQPELQTEQPGQGKEESKQPGQGKKPGQWKKPGQGKKPGKWKQPGQGMKPGQPEQGKLTEQPELEKQTEQPGLENWTEQPGQEKQTRQPGQGKKPKHPGRGKKPKQPEQGKLTEQPGLEKQTEQPELEKQTELPEQGKETGQPELRTEQPELQTGEPELQTWEPELQTWEPELQTGQPEVQPGPGRGRPGKPKVPSKGKKVYPEKPGKKGMKPGWKYPPKQPKGKKGKAKKPEIKGKTKPGPPEKPGPKSPKRPKKPEEWQKYVTTPETRTTTPAPQTGPEGTESFLTTNPEPKIEETTVPQSKPGPEETTEAQKATVTVPQGPGGQETTTEAPTEAQTKPGTVTNTTEEPEVEPIKVPKSAYEKAIALLRKYPVFDGHNDLAYTLLRVVDNDLSKVNLREDLRKDARFAKTNMSHTDIPRLRAGRVGAVFWSAFISCAAQYKDSIKLFMEQVDVIRRFIAEYPQDFMFCRTAREVRKAFRQGKIGSLIGIESGHAIDSSLGMLRTYYELGVRYMTITHACNTPWADSSLADPAFMKEKDFDPMEGYNLKPESKGVSPFGLKVVLEMNRLGMLVDLSHVSQLAMKQVLKKTKAPVIFSHSSARAVTLKARNVPDEILRKLPKNGGIIMVNFYSCYLNDSCYSKPTPMSDLIVHINHIRKVAGVDHIGIGSDYNGVEKFPVGLEDTSSFPRLFAALLSDKEVKWTEEDLAKLASGNIIRVMERVEAVSRELTKEMYPVYAKVNETDVPDHTCRTDSEDLFLR